jgi:septal ring-binding cell division protein DamX
MKSAFIRYTLLLAGFGLMYACGPSQEEINKKNKMREDSLANAREMIMKKDAEERAAAEAMQMAKAQEVKVPVKKEEPKKAVEMYKFGTKGSLCVQVESGRTTEFVDKALKKWKSRGFTNAYVAVVPGTQSNDTWYRVRLGRFTNKMKAQNAAKAVSAEFNVKAWVDNTTGEILK